MKILHKWIILVALLFIALISYGYGFSQGAAFFIALGVALEISFWFGVFAKEQHDNKHSHN